MRSEAATVEGYLDQRPPARRGTIGALPDVINPHLPEGYVETMEWEMVTWVVPLGEYPTPTTAGDPVTGRRGLDLAPHPEGGWLRWVWAAPETVTPGSLNLLGRLPVDP